MAGGGAVARRHGNDNVMAAAGWLAQETSRGGDGFYAKEERDRRGCRLSRAATKMQVVVGLGVAAAHAAAGWWFKKTEPAIKGRIKLKKEKTK